MSQPRLRERLLGGSVILSSWRGGESSFLSNVLVSFFRFRGALWNHAMTESWNHSFLFRAPSHGMPDLLTTVTERLRTIVAGQFPREDLGKMMGIPS